MPIDFSVTARDRNSGQTTEYKLGQSNFLSLTLTIQVN